MIYAGIDTMTYPGDKTMEWLWDEKNSNLWWTGYYLPEKGSSQTWAGKYTLLKGMGWGVAPLYLGKQPKTLARFAGKEKLEGYKDALAATSMAARDEMPSGTVIYFDLEGGDMPRNNFLEYYKNWMIGVVDQGYIPGLYCSYLLAPHLAKVMATVQGPPLIWAVRYQYGKGRAHKNPYPSDPPAGSYYPLASSWQLAGNSFITGPGKTSIMTDLDSSIFKDPGLRMA
jgi:glycoside hydrolase-like protein